MSEVREWKHWEFPEMRFISWEKLQLGFWYEPRESVKAGDGVQMIMGDWRIARFIIRGIYLLPNSPDAMILRLQEDQYVNPVDISKKDKEAIEKFRSGARND